jgi:hypothetical protein
MCLRCAPRCFSSAAARRPLKDACPIYRLYCPQDRAGTDVQTHRNATKAPLTGNRSTKPPPARLGPSDSTSASDSATGASGMEWWRVGLLHQWDSNMVQSTCFYKQYTVRKSANNEKYVPKMLKSKKNEIANNLNNTLPASSCLLTAQYAHVHLRNRMARAVHSGVQRRME